MIVSYSIIAYYELTKGEIMKKFIFLIALSVLFCSAPGHTMLRRDEAVPAKEEDAAPAKEEDAAPAKEEDAAPAKEEDAAPAKEEDAAPQDQRPLNPVQAAQAQEEQLEAQVQDAANEWLLLCVPAENATNRWEDLNKECLTVNAQLAQLEAQWGTKNRDFYVVRALEEKMYTKMHTMEQQLGTELTTRTHELEDVTDAYMQAKEAREDASKEWQQAKGEFDNVYARMEDVFRQRDECDLSARKTYDDAYNKWEQLKAQKAAAIAQADNACADWQRVQEASADDQEEDSTPAAQKSPRALGAQEGPAPSE